MDPEVQRVLAEARAIKGGSYGHQTPGFDPEFDPLIADVKNSTQLGGALEAKAMQHWLRTGYASKSALVADATGQILLPKDLAIDVLAVARGAGMLRSLVTVRPTQQNRQSIGTLSAATVAWGVLETGATAPDAAVAPAAGQGGDIVVQDLTTLVKIGVDELDDTPAATQQMLTEVLGDAVAEAEDTAIAAGTGSGQPRGLTLAANITAVPAAQKTAAGASNTPTLADMLAVPWTLPDRYRGRASWLIQPKAAAKIAAIVYTNGSPLWPNPGNPDPATGGGLLGWPAYVVPGLPDPSTAGATDASVLFGDIKSAYRLVDRQHMTLTRLMQRFSDSGSVGLLLRHRVGGDLVRPGALAVYTM